MAARSGLGRLLRVSRMRQTSVPPTSRLGLEAITFPADRDDEPRRLRVVLQLLAEAGNVHVNRSRANEWLFSPNAGEKLLARYDLTPFEIDRGILN